LSHDGSQISDEYSQNFRYLIYSWQKTVGYAMGPLLQQTTKKIAVEE